MIHSAPHNPVRFHLTKLLDQHLLGDRGYRALQFREAPHVAAEQLKQDQQLPPTLQDLQGFLDALRRGCWGQVRMLTFW